MRSFQRHVFRRKIAILENVNILVWYWLIWEENNVIPLGLQLFQLAVTQPCVQQPYGNWANLIFLGKHISPCPDLPEAALCPCRYRRKRKQAGGDKACKKKCGKVFVQVIEPKEEIERGDISWMIRWNSCAQLNPAPLMHSLFRIIWEAWVTLSPSLPWRDEVQHGSLQGSLLEIISAGQKASLEARAISKCLDLEGCKEWQSQELIFEQEKLCQALYLGMVIAVFIIVITTGIIVLVGDCAWDQISF